jgi:DNA primase
VRIPDDVIESVRSATDIVEVIGEYLPLVQAGRRFKALCPFHTEKTPSFTVNPELQMFHCFGCGVGGNVFSFLMRHVGLTFPEAVEMLGQRAGIPVPRQGGAGGDGGGTGRLLAALEEATRVFERNLWERQAGGVARRYLEERQISTETAREARLGYALAGFDHLRNRLTPRHDLKDLVEAGLLIAREGGRPYDRFRDRLIFPILGAGGRPVGFGARCLDGSEPKYLNSPETPLYRKRNILYGLHLARRDISQAGCAWVVEGYMDVLSLRQAGLGHVVAVSGTALTSAHARTLARYSARALLVFDGDAAGRRAVERSLPALLGEGLGVEVALLPPGEDPDSLVRRGGRAAMEGLAQQASSVINFIVSLCHESESSPRDGAVTAAAVRGGSVAARARESALRRLVEVGSWMPDRVARRLLVEEAARRLMFDEATLAGAVEARRASQATTARREPTAGRERPRPARTRALDRRYTALLGLAIADERVLERVVESLSPEVWPEGPLRSLYALLIDRHAAGAPLSPAQLAPDVEDPRLAELLAALSMEELPDDRGRAADELIRSLLADHWRREIDRLRHEIRAREASGRTEDVPELLVRVQELQRQLNRTTG